MPRPPLSDRPACFSDCRPPPPSGGLPPPPAFSGRNSPSAWVGTAARSTGSGSGAPPPTAGCTAARRHSPAGRRPGPDGGTAGYSHCRFGHWISRKHPELPVPSNPSRLILSDFGLFDYTGTAPFCQGLPCAARFVKISLVFFPKIAYLKKARGGVLWIRTSC